MVAKENIGRWFETNDGSFGSYYNTIPIEQDRFLVRAVLPHPALSRWERENYRQMV
jgi:hypothetical protein